VTQQINMTSDEDVRARVDALLTEMTPQEKAGQLTQYFYMDFMRDLAGDGAPSQPEMVEAAMARSGVGSLLFLMDPAETNRLQKATIEGNRLGIPALIGFDVIHGFRTIMPVPIAMAASWDPDVIEQGQAVAARESRAVGIHWAFAPMVDIARDPRWGRIVEGRARTRTSAVWSPPPRSAASRAAVSARRNGSSPVRSTSPGTAPLRADATTTSPTSPTPSCGTCTSRRSRPPSRPGPGTS
jgi:hypothetical protein